MQELGRMEKTGMDLDELVAELDGLFSIKEWEKDPAMSRWVPRTYEGIGFDYSMMFEGDFCKRYNGLMVRSGDSIEKVYCASFPAPEIIGTILEDPCRRAMLFLHHPIDMEVSGAGFRPISPDNIRRMKEEGISIYACHAPMDCNDTIGTTASMVQAFGMSVEANIAQYGNGFAGRVGSVAPVTLDELVARGKDLFGIARAEIGGQQKSSIKRIAVVPGGGDDTRFFFEAEEAGAEAYITGEWYTRSAPKEEKDRAWVEKNRSACIAYAEKSGMAFLGFSHAATEFLVMKNQMSEYFGEKGLRVVCLEQEDWWR